MPNMPFSDLKKTALRMKDLLANGHGLNGKAADLSGMGCDGFIQKLFNMEALSTKVRRLISKTQTIINSEKYSNTRRILPF
ncbi:MAG: hypothetical protein JW932_07230 [Deltaproteobacteria bacterium]|nr:hypothetical protein [Deltaproteobacteria bacterium]